MAGVIGIRRETKSPWDRRTPVTPVLAGHLIRNHDIDVLVQPSARRVFPDRDYSNNGARLTTDLSDARVVLGVKEIPPDEFLPETAYVFFSHVIKGQPYNMPMLTRLMTLGCTLIDYERVVDATDRRLIFFGRFAGLAGAIDTLWALGQRLESEGVTTPFAELLPAHTYDSLEEAEEAIHAVGSMISHTGLPEAVTPVVVGIAGYGNVARGVREILTQLPLREVSPDDLPNLASHASQRTIYQVTFREEHLVERIDGAPFDLQDYYSHGDAYRSRFARHLEDLTVLINANYWDERYPRLVTKDEIRELFSGNEAPRLKVIGDLGCDIEGAVECTLRATDPGDPVFVWDPATDQARSGIDGHGPVVLAVDILPAELPREASEEFASTLGPFLPALAKADFRAPFDDLDLPDPIKRAVIVHRGELTPDYAYLREFLDSAS